MRVIRVESETHGRGSSSGVGDVAVVIADCLTRALPGELDIATGVRERLASIVGDGRCGVLSGDGVVDERSGVRVVLESKNVRRGAQRRIS